MNYKPDDPEMIQAQKDLDKLSKGLLSERIINNDKDLYAELSDIQSSLLEVSYLKASFLEKYENTVDEFIKVLDDQRRIETKLAVLQHKMLHSFELVKRYFRDKKNIKKGFK